MFRGYSQTGRLRKRFDGITGTYRNHPYRFFTVIICLIVLAATLILLKPANAKLGLYFPWIHRADNAVKIGDNRYFAGDYEVTPANQPLTVALKKPSETQTLELKNVANNTALSESDYSFSDSKQPSRPDQLVVTPKENQAKAGVYQVKATNTKNGQILASEKVAWGVLAFNPDYAIYPPNSTANLAMAVLDDRGKMVCNAELSLEITSPSGQKTTLTTTNSSITVNQDCSVYGQTSNPDYSASYKTAEDGDYKVLLVAKVGSGRRTMHDVFSVKSGQSFYLQRIGASRIYPPTTYAYTLNFQAKSSGDFELTESVPSSFNISLTNATVQTNGERKTLTWAISARAGHDYQLIYHFKAPNLSPYLFLFGPAVVKQSGNAIWQESRAWLIASDNACQSNGTGGGVWSANASWQNCGGVTPQVADTVEILANDTITEDSASVTVAGVIIDNLGTFTISTTNIVNDTGSWTNNGTFNANNSTVNFTANNGSKTLNGTMIGATGKFYNLVFNTSGINATWTYAAAVETANNYTLTKGTVDADSTNNYNLTVAADFTMASGTTYKAQASTITVSGNWSQSNASWLTQSTGYGTSTVILKGTSKSITTTNGNNFYNLTIFAGATITISGSNLAKTVNNTDIEGTLTITAVCNNGLEHSGGAGTTFTIAGTLTGGGGCVRVTTATPSYSYTGTLSISNFVYAMTGSSTIPGTVNSGNIYFQPSSGSQTYTIGGTMNSSGGSFYLDESIAHGTLTFDNTVNNSAVSSASNFNILSDAGSYVVKLGSATYTIDGSWNNNDSAPITAGTSTVTLDGGASNVTSSGQSFYNFTVGGGTVTPQDALTVTNNITFTSGTFAGTQNVTVNGNVAGTSGGAVNLTGGTFEQRVGAAQNFGATTGSTAWTFFDLTFSNSLSTPVTITTQTAGTGTITVSDVLKIGKSGDSAGGTTAFSSGNRTWTLSGTTGSPFQMLASPAGTLTSTTSTFSFTGNNAGGNTTIPASAGYNLLTVNNGSETFVLNGTTTAASTVTVSNGTLDTVAGSDFALTAGRISIAATGTLNLNNSLVNITSTGTLITRTGAGVFNAGGSTVSAITTGTATLNSGTLTFNNLTINRVGATLTTLSAITINNNLTLTTGVLSDNGQQIVGNATGTLSVGSGGGLTLGVAATATLFPTNFTAAHISMDPNSTVIYNSGINQTISSVPSTYGNLTLTRGGGAGTPTKTPDGAIVATGSFTINANNIFTTTAANSYPLTVGGNYTNLGTMTANSSTVTFNGSSTQTMQGAMTGSSAFYNLAISNASGTAASDCERTGFVPGVDFSTSATASNIFSVPNVAAKLEFESGSLYSFTSVSVSGQDANNKIYLRNSNASGTWQISVTGAQTSLSYLNVSRSNASGGNTLSATGTTNCGNNTNWVFSTPSVASNLAQTKSDSTTVSTGSWTNQSSINFSATASDTANPASLQLCVETDLIGTTFSNTEDSCGSSVSYVGTPVTVSANATGLTNAAEYHWQARVKDDGGNYSGWISYGGNSESVRDFGIDTTAPATPGTPSTTSPTTKTTPTWTWSASSDNLSGLDPSAPYTVQWSQNSAFSSGVSSTTVTTNSFTHSTALAVGTWYLRVTAADAAGNTAPSATATVVINAPATGANPPSGGGTSPTTPSGTTNTPTSGGGTVTPAPEIVPTVFLYQWNLLPVQAIREFVFAPLPSNLLDLAIRLPQLGETLNKLGVGRFTSLTQLHGVNLFLPGLNQSQTAVLPSKKPLRDLTVAEKDKLPTEVVFAQTGNDLIDLQIKLNIDNQGQPKQYLETLTARPLQLATKPSAPVKSVTGQLVFVGKKEATKTPKTVVGYSNIFATPALAQDASKETRLVVGSFDYADADHDGVYTAGIVTPSVDGQYNLITKYVYDNPKINDKEVDLVTVIDPEGYVFEKMGDKEVRIPQATVSIELQDPSSNQFQLWDAANFSQKNPQITDQTGRYSFLVPSGTYRLNVTASGYKSYQSEPFPVSEGAGVFRNVELKSTNPFKQINWLYVAVALLILLILSRLFKFQVRGSKQKYE